MAEDLLEAQVVAATVESDGGRGRGVGGGVAVQSPTDCPSHPWLTYWSAAIGRTSWYEPGGNRAM